MTKYILITSEHIQVGKTTITYNLANWLTQTLAAKVAVLDLNAFKTFDDQYRHTHYQPKIGMTYLPRMPFTTADLVNTNHYTSIAKYYERDQLVSHLKHYPDFEKYDYVLINYFPNYRFVSPENLIAAYHPYVLAVSTPTPEFVELQHVMIMYQSQPRLALANDVWHRPHNLTHPKLAKLLPNETVAPTIKHQRRQGGLQTQLDLPTAALTKFLQS
ncbi:hypothetical protein [Lactiplantibacillus fabifermentans]|uniref:Uncharacterized protein n=2 Tax=Lactiplantibacillus fabifermentans TaxID=483011 RepID=A0A0R2NU28_9LACO|nr:hypothetical protein [Lactiplantibacillus fabifermentans]ETY73678.1 hypothetical protein LFAB_11290 [Lactiplantibacillus fabifermentans T30PCM01]KRO29185.1 hypothetical protein DY78_GL001351 [Lactiplantibacillus fabifermentans DSM 21115]